MLKAMCHLLLALHCWLLALVRRLFPLHHLLLLAEHLLLMWLALNTLL